MRRGIIFVTGLMLLSAATAWGQYGLYGSPDMLRLPQASAQPGYPGCGMYPQPAAAGQGYGMAPGMAPAQAYARPISYSTQAYYASTGSPSNMPTPAPLPQAGMTPPAMMPNAMPNPGATVTPVPMGPTLGRAQVMGPAPGQNVGVVDQMLQEPAVTPAPMNSYSAAAPAQGAPCNNCNAGMVNNGPVFGGCGNGCAACGNGCGYGYAGCGQGYAGCGQGYAACGQGYPACGQGYAGCGQGCGVFGGCGRGCGVFNNGAGCGGGAYGGNWNYGNGCGYGAVGTSSVYTPGSSVYAGDGYAPCAGEGPVFGGVLASWFGSVTGLVMGINDANHTVLSYNIADESIQIHDNNHYDMRGGGELSFGRRFGCGPDWWAIEAVYWTVDPSYETMCLDSHSFNPTVKYGTPIDLRFLNYGNNVPIDPLFDGTNFSGANTHQVIRTAEADSVEINFVKHVVQSSCCCPWDVSLLCGPRFFRFQERLEFDSWSDAGFGQLTDRCTNNLWGFQIGADMSYMFLPNWRIYCGPRVGLYANHMESCFDVQGNGCSATPAVNGYPCYPVHATKDSASLLAQIDVGLDWQFACRWSARIGYRLVGVTDVARPDAQIPFYLNDTVDVALVKNNGDLLMQGGYAGLTFNF